MEVHNMIETGAVYDDTEWDYSLRVVECEDECGYVWHVPYENGRLQLHEKKRVSFQHDIQSAVDDGLHKHDQDAFMSLFERHSVPHSYSANCEFRLTGGGARIDTA